MRISRCTYTLKWIKKNKSPCKKQEDFQRLRNQIFNKESNKYGPSWLFDNTLCPRQARDEALFEACAAHHSSQRSLQAKSSKKKPKFGPRTQSDHQRVHIPVTGTNNSKGKKGKSVTWKDDEGFKFWRNSKIGKIKVHQKRELKRLSALTPSQFSDHKATLKYESPGRYFMIVSFVIQKKIKTNTSKIIALILV